MKLSPLSEPREAFVSNEHVIDDLMRIAMAGAEADRAYAQLLSTKHCLLEVQRVNGSPEVELCSRTATAVCEICRNPICDRHYHMWGTNLVCTACSYLQPTKQEMLDAIEKCVELISPKHYPSLVRELDSILKRSGRAV